MCNLTCFSALVNNPQTPFTSPSLTPCLYAGFLGRLLLRTSKTTRAKVRMPVDKERRVRHVSVEKKRMSKRDQSASPERNGHPGWSNDRMRIVSTSEMSTDIRCDVIDHSVQWRLASSILDRFFLVLFAFATIVMGVWTGVHMWRG